MADHLVYLDPQTPVILHTDEVPMSEGTVDQSETPKQRIVRLNLRPLTLCDVPASDGGVDSLEVSRRRSRNGGPADSLSPREREVVKLIISGKTRKEAAFDLGVADSTVRVLYARAVRKLAEAQYADSSPAQPSE